MPRLFALALGLVPLLLPFAAQAQSAEADAPRRPSLQVLESIIETRDPEIRVEDVDGGMAVLALDHPAMDAIGWRVSPDGSVAFTINQAPPLIREPGLGDRLVPGVETSTRIRLSVAADGTPAVALADKADRPRVRMTVTPEGYGAIEFLNAAGEVIHVLAPEADAAP